MLKSVTSPPSGVKLSCIAFTAPQEASVVTVAKSADAETPKRTSLPSRFPALWSTASEASAGFPRHAAEAVGERGGDREDQPGREEVGERRRVLEGMGGVGIEEAAAVGAELL